MALPNPWYIDAEARHMPPVIRLLSYAAVEGKEGVLGETHLAVTDLDTPAGSIQVMPGGYSIIAKHLGGEFEAYVGKISTAEQVTVNPTDSSGPRTDLVILRIENPYVTGSGVWSQPSDPLNGPYAHVRVIEDVPQATNTVQSVDQSWSAITLARITRPASTGIVQQSHITDLRSIAKLGGERVVIVDPPDEPDPPAPPIAQAIFFDVVQHDNDDEIGPNITSWVNFPDDCSWNIAIPSWATGADIWMQVNNCQVRDAGVFGELRVSTDFSVQTAPVAFDIEHREDMPGWQRHPITAADTIAIPASARGKIRNFRAQARLTLADGGTMHWEERTSATMLVVFKQYPIYD